MTTIDKILKVNDINEVLDEIKEKEDDINGLFVLFTKDDHTLYSIRTRGFEPHIILGVLDIARELALQDAVDELTGEDDGTE